MQVAPRIVVHSCPLLTIYPRCCPRHATDMPQMFLFQQTFRNSSFKRNMGLWFFVKLEGDRASMCISKCHAKAHVLTELMQLSRGYIWLPYLRISRGKPPEAVSKNDTPCRFQFSGSVHCGTPCWLKALKNSPLAQIQSCSAWLKMEAPLLILTLALVSIPIVSLAAVLLLLPVARKRFTSFIVG